MRKRTETNWSLPLLGKTELPADAHPPAQNAAKPKSPKLSNEKSSVTLFCLIILPSFGQTMGEVMK